MIRFHDPRARTGVNDEPYTLQADLSEGQIAYLANGFPDSENFLKAVERSVQALLPNTTAMHWNKGNASIPAPDAMLDEIRSGSVAAIAAYGH